MQSLDQIDRRLDIELWLESYDLKPVDRETLVNILAADTSVDEQRSQLLNLPPKLQRIGLKFLE